MIQTSHPHIPSYLSNSVVDASYIVCLQCPTEVIVPSTGSSERCCWEGKAPQRWGSVGRSQQVRRSSLKRTLAPPLFCIPAMVCLVSHQEWLPHHGPKIVMAKLIHTCGLKLLHCEPKVNPSCFVWIWVHMFIWVLKHMCVHVCSCRGHRLTWLSSWIALCFFLNRVSH